MDIDTLILAALITGTFTLLGLLIAKENKVSEFRQNWIDALREEVSTLSAAITDLARQQQLPDGNNSAEQHQAITQSQIAAVKAYTSLLLRINPNETREPMKSHVDGFVRQLKVVGRACRRAEYARMGVRLSRLIDSTQPMLKAEWERVKNGERFYRWARQAAFLLLFGLLGIAVANYLDFDTNGSRQSQIGGSSGPRD